MGLSTFVLIKAKFLLHFISPFFPVKIFIDLLCNKEEFFFKDFGFEGQYESFFFLCGAVENFRRVRIGNFAKNMAFMVFFGNVAVAFATKPVWRYVPILVAFFCLKKNWRGKGRVFKQKVTIQPP